MCVAVLLFGTATAAYCPNRTIRVHVPECGASGVRLKNAVTRTSNAVKSVPYIADETLQELYGIVSYAVGKDPVIGKLLEEAGQNTKNNVVISIIWALKSLKGAVSVRFVLEPYSEKDNVYELCAYVRRAFQKSEECIHTGWLYDRNAQKIYTVDGTGMMGIGYDFNYAFDTFSAADDPWQRNFGFTRMYDNAAFLIGDIYDTIRVPFRYDGKDWMIQIWKGVYSWNMLGGEVGLYNKPIDRIVEFYDCATDPERIPMSFSISLGDETIVDTQEAPSWWQTAFTKHKLALPRDLTMRFSLTFPNEEMLKAFRDSLQTQNPDVTIRQDGLTLYCVWSGRE